MTGWKHEWWAVQLRQAIDKGAPGVSVTESAVRGALDYIAELEAEIESLNHLVYEINEHEREAAQWVDPPIDTREVNARAIEAGAR